MRSQASTLSEIAEIRDYMGKLDQWSKRLNSRLAMAERRSAPDATEHGDLQRVTDKQALRRAVGIVPGKPAPHRD